MFLSRLRLRNFRSYSEASFTFSPEINTICGPNAIGKTTILEAINYLMVGRSFRTPHLNDLIRKDQKDFYLEATFLKHDVEQTLKITIDGNEKKIYHNNTSYSTLSSLLGLLQGVVMSPDDAQLVKGSPSIRRRFLDLQLAQIDPIYVHHLSRYYRAMKHRNVLLRKKTTDAIEVWEAEMALSGEYIIQQRIKAVSDLQESASNLHVILTGENQPLLLKYQAAAQNDLVSHFQKLRTREMELGSTLTGPHRDDLSICIGGKEARHFASEGQQRSSVAALKFAEWERLNKLADISPLMLIDDVGMSLDKSRIDRLFSHIENLSQVFLTTTQTDKSVGHVLELSGS